MMFKAHFSKSKYDMKLLKKFMVKKGYNEILFRNGEKLKVDEL